MSPMYTSTIKNSDSYSNFYLGMEKLSQEETKLKEEALAIKLFEAKDCIYTSCYCEENVYMLCKKAKEIFGKNQSENSSDKKDQFYAVFVTNRKKQSAIRYQKEGKGSPYNLVIW